jgi:hypothetical protein
MHMFRLESTHTMPATGARTGYDDVPGNCQGSTVDECKAMCLSTQGCGGFNYPHGVRESQQNAAALARACRAAHHTLGTTCRSTSIARLI